MDKVMQELKKVKGQAYCVGCKHFYFEPEKESGHYYLSEDEAQGNCIFFKNEKVGTMSNSVGCKHWTRRE